MDENKLITTNKLAEIMQISFRYIDNLLTKKSYLKVDTTIKNYINICNAKKIAYHFQGKSSRRIEDIISDLDNYKPY